MIIRTLEAQPPASARPLGELTLPPLPIGVLNLQTVALVGLAGLVVYLMFFGSAARQRKKALKAARSKYRAAQDRAFADYRAEVARIKGRAA